MSLGVRDHASKIVGPLDFGDDFDVLGAAAATSVPAGRAHGRRRLSDASPFAQLLVHSESRFADACGPLPLHAQPAAGSATCDAIVHGGSAAGGKPTPSSAIVINTLPAPRPRLF